MDKKLRGIIHIDVYDDDIDVQSMGAGMDMLLDALANAMVRMASDFEVSTRAFNLALKDMKHEYKKERKK